MADCSQDIFTQYAQDPLENFTQQYKDLFGSQSTEVKQKRKKRVVSRQPKKVPLKSFVVSKEQRGIKLIQIKVLELTTDYDAGKTSSETAAKNENVVLSAQYVVRDSMDEIMDMTECVIKKISKHLSGDSF